MENFVGFQKGNASVGKQVYSDGFRTQAISLIKENAGKTMSPIFWTVQEFVDGRTSGKMPEKPFKEYATQLKNYVTKAGFQNKGVVGVVFETIDGISTKVICVDVQNLKPLVK